jgi:hypothetical protein
VLARDPPFLDQQVCLCWWRRVERGGVRVTHTGWWFSLPWGPPAAVLVPARSARPAAPNELEAFTERVLAVLAERGRPVCCREVVAAPPSQRRRSEHRHQHRPTTSPCSRTPSTTQQHSCPIC